MADASFAGLLASLATPQNRESAWTDAELAEDVATISYEQALRKHGRSSSAEAQATPEGSGLGEASKPETGSSAVPKPLKNSSITIRLSEAECAQLRRRASEAGMTVSAYLRSCTLEVESLRAQVKETLAQLRTSAQVPPEPPRGIVARVRDWLLAMGRRRRFTAGVNPANPLAPAQI
jgi:hypothetical protein